MCCSVLQCVALCCSDMTQNHVQFIFKKLHVCCSVLQHIPACCTVSCSVLQCVAVCRSKLQCAAPCCSVLQWNSSESPADDSEAATRCNMLQHAATHMEFLEKESQVIRSHVTAIHCNIMQYTATCCNTLQHTATLQHAATYCSTLQHTATCCGTLQHAATCCNINGVS